jgi:hypothetical protein
MSNSTPATHKEKIAIGVPVAAFGTYIVLVGAAVLPVPGGPSNLHAPLWVVIFVGLVFFLAGAALLLQGIGKANAQAELPADAPAWMGAVQQLIGVAIFASFAMIASWIAIGGDPRQFSGSFMGLGIGVSIARIAFGISALICWACTIAFAVSAVRKYTARSAD